MSFKQYTCRADRIKQLIVNLKMRKKHPKVVARLTHKLIEEAFKSEKYGFAFDACMELGDKELLREFANRAYKKCPTFGMRAFRKAGDERGVLKVVKYLGRQNEPNLLDAGLGLELRQGVNTAFHQYSQAKGLDAQAFDIVQTSNAAWNLSRNYDVSVGIANGGLWGSYMLGLFNLKTITCQPDKETREIRWLDTPELQGKRVLVCDKDVKTGVTLAKFLEEARKYSPASLDLFLNYPAVNREAGIGSVMHNVPDGFGNIYTPDSFDYKNFHKAYAKLMRRFG